jgi:hypothetical protein
MRGREIIVKFGQDLECALGMNLDEIRDLRCCVICVTVKILAKWCVICDDLDGESWDVVNDRHGVAVAL